ncbi:MAG TPA: hypothetical protein VFK87_07040 [Steroidobacteraceae bacterium]|nr:hypothetical protein [Steroidobacteraceae bacterium]
MILFALICGILVSLAMAVLLLTSLEKFCARWLSPGLHHLRSRRHHGGQDPFGEGRVL